MASEDRLKDYFVYTDEDFKAEQFWAVENQPCDLLSNEVDYEDCEKYVVNKGELVMNNNKSNKSTSKGVGFGGLLTIVFIVLKLLKIIEWSWVWVLSPIWIPTAFIILIMILYVIANKNVEKNKRKLNELRK